MITFYAILWVVIGVGTCILLNKYQPRHYDLLWAWGLLGPVLWLLILLEILQTWYDNRNGE